MSERRKYVLFAALALVSAALDQASKVWVREHLPSFGRGGMSVMGRRLVLVYAENPGIAFSQLQEIHGGRILLSLVSLLALVMIGRFVHKTPASRPWTIAALGLICGGALGNLIDRVARGSVTDFVLADLGVWPFHPWPVFNVADAALVVGVAILALALMRAKGPHHPAAPAGH